MVRTKAEDALDILGRDSIDLVRELEEYEREEEKSDRTKSRAGMVYKSGEPEGLSYGGATTMAGARTYIANLKRREQLGESVGKTVGCLSNIYGSDMSPEEMKDKAIKVFYDAANEISKKAKVKILKEKRMSESRRYVGVGGSYSIKAAVRFLQGVMGTKNLEIDLPTLKAAVAKNIMNLPPGARERAAAQLKADLAHFPGGEPTKPGSVRWVARMSSGLDPTK